MSSTFNSTFGGLGQKPSPHAIGTDKSKGSFYANVGKNDINRHAIPPVPPMNADLTNPIPTRGINSAQIQTASISLNPAPSAVASYPFKPVFSGTNATITYGTLNGVAPTNIGSTFTVPTTGTRYLVLTASASSGSVTSSSLSVTTTPPSGVAATVGFPPATYPILLYVIVNQVLFRVIGPGSLYALPKEAFRIQKSMPTPDLLPYDTYYNWIVYNA